VATLQEDLFQEALIHLWLQEERRPGQTKSWYLQNCQYYLRNYLARGKSVDSLKRGRLGRALDSQPAEDLDMESPHGGGVFATVSAKDIVGLLNGRLSSREREILACLSLGFGAREIARRLGISHPAVVKHRQRIAQQALKLGINPLPHCRRRRCGFLPCRREAVEELTQVPAGT
jgi:DNA-directed RNA polymerase specialized sigma24 family protein